MAISILHLYMCVQFQNILAYNEENKFCLPNKESISGHRFEKTNMAVKCEMLMNCSKKNYTHLQKANKTVK